MQISLLAGMVPREFPAAPLINNNFYYTFCAPKPFRFSLLTCFIFEGTLPQEWHLGTWAPVFLIHKFTLVFLYLQVAGWGWTVCFGDNFHIFQHLNTAFAYTQHQRQAIRGNPRGWGSWKLQILLAPGWYGDFYTPFRRKIEQPPGQARPVPSLFWSMPPHRTSKLPNSFPFSRIKEVTDARGHL